jgi:phage shock protein C
MTVQSNPSSNSAQPDDPNTTSHDEQAMLYRHPTAGLAGGVCAGLGDFLHVDPVLVRVIWVAATVLTSGAGVLVYLLLWLLLPVGTQAEGETRPPAIQFRALRGRGLATLMLAIGVAWLLLNLGALPSFARLAVSALQLLAWPLLLIGIGILILRSLNGGKWLGFGKHSGASPWAETAGAGNAQPWTQAASAWRGARQSLPWRRSESDRVLLGVCGGIAAHMGVDAVFVRLGWVVLTLVSMGLGIFLYLLAGLILPSSSPSANGGTSTPVDFGHGDQVVEIEEIMVIGDKTTQV